MPKFQYKVSQRNVIASTATLNEFGEDGWELVCITNLQEGYFPLVYTFKRETS